VSHEPPGGGTWTGVAVTVAGVLVTAAAVLLIPGLRDAVGDAVSGDTTSVREDLDGAGGALLVLGLALVHTFVWYPAEILDAAAGYVFDFLPALALVMTGWLISGVLAYLIGRHAARPLLLRVIGDERFLRVERLIHRGGIPFLLVARLVPIVPFSLLGYVAGAARVPLPRFVWTTAVGYLPITAYFVYVGGSLESFSAEDPILWVGAFAFVIAIFGVRFLFQGGEHEAHREDDG
jgi:uncharacterized membrane protein YdjX (TVP38/TMEM64 family)